MIIFMGKTGKGDLQPRSYWKSRTLKGPVDSYCTEIEFDLLHLIPTHLRRMDSLINMGRQEIHACFFFLPTQEHFNRNQRDIQILIKNLDKYITFQDLTV